MPPADRPFTVANFVMSVDGRATIDGRSGGLGDDGDHAIFHCLREQVDAVLVGTGTLRAERYGRVLGKPERRQRRIDRGQTPEPLLATVSRSGDIPTDIPLFAEPEARVVIFSAATPDVSGCAAEVEVVSLDPAQLTFTTVMRHLRDLHAVRTLLCEGGPTVFGSLLQEDLVDDLFLTIAPKLAGGGHGPTIRAARSSPIRRRPGSRGCSSAATRSTCATPCTEALAAEPRLPIVRGCHNQTMASSSPASATVAADETIAALTEARARTLALVQSVSNEDLERVHSTLMSPLVWDLGHIAAFEDLWLVHRYGGRPLLHDDLADVYDAFETPRAERGDLPFLRADEAREYLAEVRARTLDVIEERGVGDGLLHEMVIRHEHQHDETMLQTLQLARLTDYEPAQRRPSRAAVRPRRHRPRARLDPRRRMHDRRARGRVRLRQRAPPPPHRRPRVPDRPRPDHERHLSDVRRGRRLRAARVVV